MQNIYIVIDIETGGLSRRKNGICEIAWVVMDHNFNTLSKSEYLVRPYERLTKYRDFEGQPVSYTDEAMIINGINVNDLADKGYDLWEIENHFHNDYFNYRYGPNGRNNFILVGHNLEDFDFPWLADVWETVELLFDDKNKRLDTLTIAREKRSKGSSNKLKTLCSDYGVFNNNEHRALGDAVATAKLLPILLSL